MRLIHFIWCYVAIVLSFAVINQLIFWKDSTSFLISEQMNKHIERYEFLGPEIDLAKFHENAKDKMPISFEGIYSIVIPEINKLDSVYSSIGTFQKELDSIKEEKNLANQSADVERQIAIDAFLDSRLEGYQKRIDSLQRYMIGKDTTELIINGKYVELARLKREYAEKNAKELSNVLEHYGSFIPDSLSSILSHLYNEDVRLTKKLEELEGDKRSIVSGIKDTVRSYHNNRYDTVNFLDFVYYSICVSTTVSFGDIAPNCAGARFAAIIELLLCLVLVCLILEKMKILIIPPRTGHQ